MATLEQKFHMLDNKNIKIRLAHLINNLDQIYEETGEALQSQHGKTLTVFNSDIASDYKLDEELLLDEIDVLRDLGLINEVYDEDQGIKYISPKPRAVKLARQYLIDNNYPEMPQRTYHLYRLDSPKDEYNIHIPIVMVVRHNPYSVNQIAPISDETVERLSLTPNDKKFMDSHFDELNKAITHVLKETPIAFHLSPKEWEKANEHNPPLTTLIEQINAGYTESEEIKNRPDIKDKSDFIAKEYKAGNIDSIQTISNLLEDIKQDMRREMRGEANQNILK